MPVSSCRYHTLINLRWYFFFLLFVGSYMFLYSLFALMYWGSPRHCLSNVDSYLHALWFSVQTAATIGYGHISPNPVGVHFIHVSLCSLSLCSPFCSSIIDNRACCVSYERIESSSMTNILKHHYRRCDCFCYSRMSMSD